MQDFSTPYKRGVNKFMVQTYLTYQGIVSQETTYKEFEGLTIISLRKNIMDYCRAYGFKVCKLSEIYVVHEETTFTKVQGFSLNDNEMKGVMLR